MGLWDQAPEQPPGCHYRLRTISVPCGECRQAEIGAGLRLVIELFARRYRPGKSPEIPLEPGRDSRPDGPANSDPNRKGNA